MARARSKAIVHVAELAGAGMQTARAVRGLALHPDGSSVWAITSRDLHGWWLPSGESVGTVAAIELTHLRVGAGRVVAVGDDGVFTWDTRTLKRLERVEVRPLKRLTHGFAIDPVRVLFGRRPPRVLVAGDENRTVKLPGTGGWYAVSPRGLTALHFNTAGSVTLLDLETGAARWKRTGGDDRAALACYLDETAFLVVRASGAVAKHDVSAGAIEWERTVRVEGASAVAASGDGQRAVIAGANGTLVIETRGGRSIRWLPDHAHSRSAALNEDGTWLAMERNGTQVVAVNLSTRRETAGSALLGGAVESLAWSRDGRRLYSTASGDPVVRVWDAVQGKPAHAWEVDSSERVCAALSPEGDRMAFLAPAGVLRVWEVASGAELARWDVEKTTSHLAWLPDASGLVTCGATENAAFVACWHPDTGASRWRHQEAHEFTPKVFGVECAPDASRVWWLVDKSLVHLDAKSGARIERGALSPYWLALRPRVLAEGREVAGVVADCTSSGYHYYVELLVWDTVKARTVWAVDLQSEGPCSMDAEGRWCAVVQGNAVLLWDLRARERVARLSTDWRGDVVCVAAVSPDGTSLAVGTARGALHLYRIAPDAPR